MIDSRHNDAAPDLTPEPRQTPRNERSIEMESTRSTTTVRHEPVDLDEYPPFDGSVPLDVWRWRRDRAVKMAAAKRSSMLQVIDSNGHTLYRINGSGNVVRTRRLRKPARKRIVERDGGRCQLCGSTEWLQVDHIVRYIDGGSDDPENLRTLCEPCHRKRGRRS